MVNTPHDDVLEPIPCQLRVTMSSGGIYITETDKLYESEIGFFFFF